METTKYWRCQGWEQACMWAAHAWEKMGRSLSGRNSEKNGFGSGMSGGSERSYQIHDPLSLPGQQLTQSTHQ